MIEKRIEKRSPIQLAASFGIEEDPRPEREVKIKNVSSGGFCFSSDHKLRIGERLQLAVDLDTIEEVIITVKVAWVKKDKDKENYEIGVQIVEKEGPAFERFVEYYNKEVI